jgi:hypothetical protein
MSAAAAAAGQVVDRDTQRRLFLSREYVQVCAAFDYIDVNMYM